jgi:hypothetical protein
VVQEVQRHEVQGLLEEGAQVVEVWVPKNRSALIIRYFPATPRSPN